METKISFWWDAEKRIRVAKAGEKDSLFYEAYQQALAGVAEIVRASIMQTRGYDSFFPQSEPNGQNELRTTCDSEYLYDYPNNLVIFSGERGAGKSSAMLTFVSGLKDKDGLLFKDDFLSRMVDCELPEADASMVKKMLQTCHFVDLAPIDPTTLEENGQILTVILARMFRMASSVWENRFNRLEPECTGKKLEEKKQLIQKFSNCYEHVQAIKNGGEPKPEYDGLETLAELGDSSRLKMELYQLVRQLLQFCSPEAGESSYLVLQIDDTDMNIKKAYDILEDVRRYLVIPRLIIVMAADLKHLTQVVESSLLKDYDKSLTARHTYVEKITHQYITKLFPQTRQIDLPALGIYLREHADSINICYQIPGKALLPDNRKETFANPQDQIFRLIYQKTGMVFLRREHDLHPIIPCNMRLLAHFLSMLVQMDKIDDPDANEPGFFLRRPDSADACEGHARELRTRLQNIQRFRNYFLTTWVSNSLGSDSAQMFKGLEQTDVASRIRYTCAQLSKRWNVEREEASLPSRCGDYADIVKSGQYADMAQICQDIAERSWNGELKLLAFAVQTYYSLFAQTLAVEDLIDYYDACARKLRRAEMEQKNGGDDEESGATQYGSENTGLGCSFSRLHLLFGPQIFPYFQEEKQDEVTIEFPRVEGDKAPELLRISWQTNKTSSLESNGDMKTRQCAALLYSLLADYRTSNEKEKITLDLTRPITNCLYLGDYSGMTPFSREIFGEASSNTAMMGEESWYVMRNSSLLTVLNCDVQTKLSAALRRRFPALEKNRSSEDTVDYHDWITRVNDMYRIMKDALETPSPIQSLAAIDFSKWMEPVTLAKVADLNDWEEVVESLNPYLTYTPLSQTPAGGENTSAAEGEGKKSPAAPKENRDEPAQLTLEQ